MIALYQLAGILPPDQYLSGQYQWATRQRLVAAQLTVARPPVLGTLILTLELDGVLQPQQFTIAASLTESVQTLALDRTIPAHTWVRWRAAGAGLPEAAAFRVDLTLTVAPAPLTPVRRPRLTLQWVNAAETLTLYTYDALTHTFTETTPGVSAGRAVIAQTGDVLLQLAMSGQDVLRVEGGQLQARPFYVQGGVATLRLPRLGFYVDDVRIASLTTEDFRLTNLTEGAPLALTPDDDGFYERFEFYSDGLLTATLADNGLTALELIELG